MSNIKTQSPARQMLAFKRYFHRGDPAWFQIVPEPEKTSPVRPKSVFGHLNTHRAGLLAANAKGAGVFMTINTLTRAGRSNANVTGVNAVFIDVDGTMSLKDIKALDPQPHLVTCSSKGKYHCYWRVKGLPVARFPAVQAALARKLRTDLNVTDAARVMRMPGTMHCKVHPTPVKLLHLNENAKPLTVTELVAAFDLEIEERLVEEVEDKSAFPPGETSADEVRSAVSAIPVAHDRETWLKVIMGIHNALGPTQEAYVIAADWSRQSPHFDEADQRKTWNSLKRGGRRTKRSLFALAREHGWRPGERPSALPTDEFGLVNEFAKRVEHRLCFDRSCKTWLAFQQPSWVIDDPQVIETAEAVVQGMYRDAKSANDTAAIKLLTAYAKPVGVRRLLNDAADKSALNAHRKEFDTSPYLFPAANGVIDLRDGSFRPGLPQDRLIRRAATVFDQQAQCPRFLAFIEFVTRRNKAYAKYLQRALGYTLFGHANEHKFFIVMGRTRNGKGTLFRILKAVIGDFVTAVSPNLLSKAYSGNPNGPTPAIMALHGGRMLQCSEGEERHRFDTAFMKQVVGGDLITARANYGEPFQFTVIGKFWISSNHLPEVSAQDDAMWERYVMLPFDNYVERKDESLEPALKEEASGILNWLIEGAVSYHRDGLRSCNVVERATANARRAGDSLEGWITECCNVGEDLRLQSQVGYEAYRKFCRVQGVQPLSSQKFRPALIAKGYLAADNKRHNGFAGLALRD